MSPNVPFKPYLRHMCPQREGFSFYPYYSKNKRTNPVTSILSETDCPPKRVIPAQM